jgi:hypothetical protein
MRNAILLSALLALPAQAADVGKVNNTTSSSYLSAVSCTASTASRTFTLVGQESGSVGKLGGYGMPLAVLMVRHPAHSTATNIAIVCYSSEDAWITRGQLPVCVPNGVGGCTYYGATYNVPVAVATGYLGGGAETGIPVRVDIHGHVDVKCIATCTAGAGGDTVSVDGHLVTGN